MKRTCDKKSSGFRVERFVGGLESAIGMPSDPDAIPEVRYQVLGDKVFSLQHWKDDSTLRGEIELQTLADLAGISPRKAGMTCWVPISGRSRTSTG